jgi:ribosomal protein S18 acetylase RimI-like enzyme
VPAPTRTTTTDLDRIVAHLCAVEDAVAERTEALPWGTAVFHGGMPLVREVNHVRVESGAPPPDADVVIAACEERYADRPYRNVEVLQERAGALLAPEFAAAGWRTTRHLLMALEADAPAPPGAGAPVVDEVDAQVVWPLREEWIRSEPGVDDALAEALLAWEAERARVTGARAFTVRGEDGAPAAMCLLMRTPHADEIELVYTTPAARRRGLGSAVVGHAAREAGRGLTMLFTDADGPAQFLYRRLGFRPVGLVHRFAREARPAPRRAPLGG